MDLVNGTRMLAAWNMGFDKQAREHLVVVVKGTFLIPDDGGAAALAPPEAQLPLCMADTFEGEPGFSAPVEEADFARYKPRCDVIIHAHAYAPEGRPVERVRAGLRLGSWQKALEVVGDRVWTRRGPTIGGSAPQPFERMPITYARAFGGLDRSDPDEPQPYAYHMNPVGRGWHRVRNQERLQGFPLPNIETIGEPVTSPWGDYRPTALGPVARGWQPRLALAGTYDQAWQDEVFPFLPADFDDRHLQAAPQDQQIAYPNGGEPVLLLNLTPEGRLGFRLPELRVPVVFLPRGRERVEQEAALDTIVIEPDARRLALVWRANLPLRRNVFEVPTIVVGSASRAWWRAREMGKTYYTSLAAVPPDERGSAT